MLVKKNVSDIPVLKEGHVKLWQNRFFETSRPWQSQSAFAWGLTPK
jgi:hypothetical protein